MERTYEDIVRDMQRIDGIKRQKREALDSMDPNDPRQHADIGRMLNYLNQLDEQASELFVEYLDWCCNHGLATKHWFDVELR